MDLYLIRHADAVPFGEGDINSDEDRPLSQEGEKQARSLGVTLQRKGVRLGTVLVSPLLRTRQTAERLLEDWSSPVPELQVCDSVAPGFKRRRLARTLRDLKVDGVALVGHQPDLGELAGWLIGSKKARVDFDKAGVAYISCQGELGRGCGTLIWLVTPHWL